MYLSDDDGDATDLFDEECSWTEYNGAYSQNDGSVMVYCSQLGVSTDPTLDDKWDDTKKIAVAGLVLASILGVAGVAMSAYVLIAGPMAAKQAVPAVEMTTV